ncbi:MAG: riboflavin synthase, partial [Proteobacteria bacterium]|nr:riboflavin synthase [Pseudomonadota bacterium]
LGDELGGHFVSGHVDGVAEALERREEGDSLRLAFAAPAALLRCIAPKGSVALDGVSLTVNEVRDEAGAARFEINIIAHTAQVTTLGACRPGTRVNLEIDVLARYVQRLLAKD